MWVGFLELKLARIKNILFRFIVKIFFSLTFKFFAQGNLTLVNVARNTDQKVEDIAALQTNKYGGGKGL